MIAIAGAVIGMVLLGIMIEGMFNLWLLKQQLAILKESGIDPELIKEIARLLGDKL